MQPLDAKLRVHVKGGSSINASSEQVLLDVRTIQNTEVNISISSRQKEMKRLDISKFMIHLENLLTFKDGTFKFEQLISLLPEQGVPPEQGDFSLLYTIGAESAPVHLVLF
jgi:phosphotransferase system HPr-like phosphotransfer protein